MTSATQKPPLCTRRPGRSPSQGPSVQRSYRVIVDLEDAVALQNKDKARQTIRAWLAELPANPGAEISIRVNSEHNARARDLACLAAPERVHGIVLPKATAASICELAVDLDRRAAMSTILIAPLIETARGVTELEEIAGAERVSHVMYGQADLGAELGLAPGDDERG